MILEARGIERAFGSRRALVGATLAVDAGEVVLLVGRNGAGKTTLLRVITGFLDPDRGDVTIGGASMARARASAQAAIGYLPEHAPAPAELTVREHLRLRARQKRCAGGLERAIAAAAIEDVLAQRIGTLSKGYRQRVGLADALLGEPPLLVLDEPTSGMDPIQVAALRGYLSAVAPGRAIVVSSHAVADLESIATRVAVLRAGAIVADGEPAALCAQTKTARLHEAVLALLGAAA